MNPIYFSALQLVAFAGFWAAMTALMAFVGGWTSLARSYRGRLAVVTDRVWMGSGSISRFGIPLGYANVLNVAVGDGGVQLSLFPLFALGSPPLVIPWSDVGSCRSWRVLGLLDRFSFHAVDCGVKITLFGSAARLVKAQVAAGAIRRALAAA